MSFGIWHYLSIFSKASIFALTCVALLGSRNDAGAAVISYTLTNVKATFRFIPNPPPSQPVFATLNGSFDFDAATNTQSNVKIMLTGDLVPGEYSQLAPFQTQDNRTLAVAPPRFADGIVIHFLQPLDGTSAIVPIFSVSILSIDPLDPCSPSPTRLVCNAFQVVGGAETQNSSTGVNGVPEPTSLLVFGPLALAWGIGRTRHVRRTRPLVSRKISGAVPVTLCLAVMLSAGLDVNEVGRHITEANRARRASGYVGRGRQGTQGPGCHGSCTAPRRASSS